MLIRHSGSGSAKNESMKWQFGLLREAGQITDNVGASIRCGEV